MLESVPVLVGEEVRLEPLTEAVLEDYLAGMNDEEGQRLTMTRTSFSRGQIEEWLRTRQEQTDRADWAILSSADGAFLGEAVLNELSVDDLSVNYRIWLVRSAWGRGIGTETTRLVSAWALQSAGLHRVSLTVLAANERAWRAYEKAGFEIEGRMRESVRWDGEWLDELLMAKLAG